MKKKESSIDIDTIIEEVYDKYPEIINQYEITSDKPISLELQDLTESIKNSKMSKNSIVKMIEKCIISANLGSFSLSDMIEQYITLYKNPKPDIGLYKYFSELNEIYKDVDLTNEIPFCPENREQIIKTNLRTVVSIARKYCGLGVDLEDLISAGNLGLCVSFDKYKPQNSKLKEQLIEDFSRKEIYTTDEIINILEQRGVYGKIKDNIKKSFTKEKYNKSFLLTWVDKNIAIAKFNSVASMWIKAYILNEISSNSRTVKKTKSDIIKEKEDNNNIYQKENKISLDQPIGDNENTTVKDILLSDEDDINTRSENLEMFRTKLEILLSGLSVRHRRILLSKFGVGIQRPMLPKEIAIRENISVARITQIIQDALLKIRQNAETYNINSSEIYELLENA